MTLLGKLLQPAEQRATMTSGLNFEDIWGSAGSFGENRSHAGRIVSQHSALQLIAVWACVRLIAESIASLPTDAFTRQGRQRISYPNPQWMWTPNPEQTAMQFWEQMLTGMLLYGNAYAYIVRAPDTTVLEIWPMHPEWVHPRRDGPNNKLVYYTNDQWGRIFELTKNVDILHIPAFSLPGMLTGLNPIQYAKQGIGLGLSAEEYGARYFAQGSSADVALESDKVLDEKVAKRVALSWRKKHSGLKNSHYPLILEGGLTAKPLTIPNDQAQFLETRMFTVIEIARFFRVPPHLVGEVTKNTSWGTGIEEQSIGFVTNTLRVWMERMEQAVVCLFPPESRAFMKFDADELTRGNLQGRMEAYAIAVQNGFNNPDEIRAKENDPPIPDGHGQTFYHLVNAIPVGTTPPVGAPPPPAPKPPTKKQETGTGE